MAKVLDVSSKLGEYMLKGWVLTDRICSNCSKVPLMRSPSGSVSFCANCHDAPSTSGLPSDTALTTQERDLASNDTSSSSFQSSSRASRPSTPLTEVSSTLSSPTFAPPIDTEEVLRRRLQSDAASAEIGKRLLKGWAMLADECPSTQCFGIPLVRPPKSGRDNDPRKECVICHTVYVNETNATGWSHLVPLSSSMLPSQATAAGEDSGSSPEQLLSPSPVLDKGKGSINLTDPSSIVQSRISDQAGSLPPPRLPKIAGVSAGSTTLSVLEDSAQALESSLHCLASKLRIISGGPGVDVVLIAQTADAIGKVSQTLMQVKQLQRQAQVFGS